MSESIIAAARRLFGSIDTAVRAHAPRCPTCGRPDGGVVPAGSTPWEAGLVDRVRCPREDCPMRTEAPS